MRRFISLLIILVCTFGLLMQSAEAKRFGGGRSFGMQRSFSQFSKPTWTRPAMQQRSGANKWLGPLAGLAAGGLLASLFMGHGFASGMMSWLVIAGIALLLFNLLRGRTQHAFTEARQSNLMNLNASRDTSGYFGGNNNAMRSASTYSSLLNQDDFLREAKSLFIRLQAAYDQKNINDIHRFTDPSVFAEIQLQIQERGNDENITEVITLNAELLDATDEPGKSIVTSVRFTGLIREDKNASPLTLNEVWHFEKSNDNEPWKVVGIQAENNKGSNLDIGHL